MVVLFNKDKQFIGYGDNFPSNPELGILKKEISSEEFDLSVWRWDGDFDTGSMVKISDNPYPINNMDLQNSLYEKIYKEYPIDLQNLIIIKKLKIICDNMTNNIMTDEFKNMSDLIIKAVEIYDHENKFYLAENE
jgi:hypothetical protein